MTSTIYLIAERYTDTDWNGRDWPSVKIEVEEWQGTREPSIDHPYFTTREAAQEYIGSRTADADNRYQQAFASYMEKLAEYQAQLARDEEAYEKLKALAKENRIPVPDKPPRRG